MSIIRSMKKGLDNIVYTDEARIQNSPNKETYVLHNLIDLISWYHKENQKDYIDRSSISLEVLMLMIPMWENEYCKYHNVPADIGERLDND